MTRLVWPLLFLGVIVAYNVVESIPTRILTSIPLGIYIALWIAPWAGVIAWVRRKA